MRNVSVVMLLASIGVCCVLAQRAAWGDEPLTLVRDGRPTALVVLADEPSRAAREGAALLVALLERISGARLATVQEGQLGSIAVEAGEIEAHFEPPPQAFVLVGESRLANRLGVNGEGLGPGGILLRTCANALILLGADDRTPGDPDGTRYAVTAFLEDVVGCRFLWPGELGLVVPDRRTIELPALDRRFTPLIAQRKIRSAGYSDRMQVGLDYLAISQQEYEQLRARAMGKSPQVPDWFQWQRLGGSVGLVAGHAFGYTWEKYHREHPDWFAQQPNGSRDISRLTPERARLCKSNLQLIEALARDKIQELSQTGSRSASLCPNDGGLATFCMCPECRKLDPPQGRRISLLDNSSGPRREFEYVSLTDRHVWFWNQLADRICKVHPDACLAVYAYSAYKAPPLRERLHPNLAVGFVGVNYASERDRQQARADWDTWAAAAQKLYWRPNLLLFARREGTPAVFVHKLAEDLRYFAHHSLVATDFDSCVHHWATEGLNYYVLARLLWNPDADVDAVVDDYCRAGFGSAWKDVRRYLRRVEQLTSQIAAKELTPVAPYTPPVVAELREILSAARENDHDERVQQRIEFLGKGLDFAALQQQTHKYVEQPRNQPLTDQETRDLQRALRQKWLFMRQLLRENFLAVHVPMVAWGSEGSFRRFGWQGAKNIPDLLDADEEGQVIPATESP